VIDKVHNSEYSKVSRADKDIFKGAKYLLLKNRFNVHRKKDRQQLHGLLKLNEVINMVLILKGKLKHIWSYRSRGWATKALDVPIIHQREVIGNLLVGNKVTDYDERDQELLEIITDHIAPILSARLQRHREQRERKRAEERVEHLNLVLRAIRKVNQLITREKDRDRLIQGICDDLIETCGYYNAWIALLDESGSPLATAEAGLGKDFLPMVNQLKRGEITTCGQKALAQSGAVVTKDPIATCTDCPLASKYGGRGAITVRLEHDGKIHGLFSVSIPPHLTEDKEGEFLFEEIARDISFALFSIELDEKRKKAEEDLRRMHDHLENLINYANAPIIVWDPGFRITRCNRSFERMTGYKEKEVTGQELSTLFPEATRDESLSKIELTSGGEYWESVEIPIHRRDGDIRLALWNSANIYAEDGKTLLATIAQGQDITKRKQAEEALRVSEEKYRILVESSPDAILMMDKERNVVTCNEAFVNLFGYKKREIEGKSIRLIHQSDESFHSFGKTAYPVINRTGSFRTEWEFMHKDGTIFPVETVTSALKSPHGSITGYMAIVTDITERKQAQEEHKKLESQLEQAQRMEAIGTLAGGIAHDFNNILSLIIGYTELVLDEIQKGSQFWEDLREVYQAAKRARDLVKQILVFSRQDKSERKPMKLHLVVTDALKLLRSSLPATIEIRQHLTATGMVLADPTQIEQVIMNFCTNAYHAMRERGGVLEVRLEDMVLEGEAAARQLELRPGPYVTLTVRDTGHGMSGAVMDHIFEPYFTTKETGEGTGMGLAAVHGIVKGHGGAITVDSAPDKGATFQVFLPRADGAEAGEQPREGVLPPEGTERMLFVDDEQAMIEMGRRTLEHLGYEVVTSTSGIEALEAFRAQPDKFDLVITDMTMPKMTGDEFATELMRIRPEIPIILCTGFSERITEKKAKRMGIRKFIMKPLVMRELAEAVREVLDV
jgi:PAS domain S-box-containing protein